MPKLIFYRKKCVGCGFCAENAPFYFKRASLGNRAELLQPDEEGLNKCVRIVPVEKLEYLKKITKQCPSHALTLVNK